MLYFIEICIEHGIIFDNIITMVSGELHTIIKRYKTCKTQRTKYWVCAIALWPGILVDLCTHS